MRYVKCVLSGSSAIHSTTCDITILYLDIAAVNKRRPATLQQNSVFIMHIFSFMPAILF